MLFIWDSGGLGSFDRQCDRGGPAHLWRVRRGRLYGTPDNPDSTRADLNVLSLPLSRPREEMYPVTDPLEPKARIFENAVKFL